LTERARTVWRKAFALVFAALVVLPPPAPAAELRQETLEAFDRYVRVSEAKIDAELSSHEPFLWLDRLPAGQREAALAQLRQGHVVTERLETLDNGKSIPIPGGLIHHWIGTTFIPGVTLRQTLAFAQDYDHHFEHFRPDVMRSKILRRDGDDFVVSFRFHRKKVVTSILDTEHAIHYHIVDDAHAWSRSHTTRVQEVEDAGEPGEHLKPVGQDRGFLWRMNNYWRFEEKDGGTYVECQSISLTRDIPAGLGWIISRFVNSIPRESLDFTLGTMRAALLQSQSTASK
jgi:hypothetical protein